MERQGMEQQASPAVFSKHKVVITDEAVRIKEYIEREWGRLFTVILEVRLNRIFPEPENAGLHHIWKYGSADMVVFRHDKPVAIIEVGGSHHWQEKQSLNDRRKWKLADVNGVRGIAMINGMMDSLSKRKFREMIGAILFGMIPTKVRIVNE